MSYVYPNGHPAVEGVSLSVERGESVAVIGQNGAGKTTLVKMMNGLLRPSTGSIEVDGVHTRGRSTADVSRQVGYVFQNPDDQIFHDDVASEIAFGPRRLGFDREKVIAQVLRAAKLCRIDDQLTENPYNIPFGLRKFVTIASVIAMDPDVIILDEPTAGQDAAATALLSDLLRTLTNDGKSVVTITHDREFVAENFARTVGMADRRVLADTKTAEAFAEPDLLLAAGLAAPAARKLADRIGLGGSALSMPELVSQLMGRSTAGV
ncbi:energy-coupling factor ABC transporter ATP-binding protein [Saccharopolyspora sp. ASAGF58]|uniref:energy-coupling factor ABC transporter ATP-binding protein n=1 Tax=Saccharopolyspora sp. ASAGF58 TaxID=2719023 RepID=UPI001B300882|nr:ABC transporter ATP-binding protein [Saccharopolyspora sp. ASAGF58]